MDWQADLLRWWATDVGRKYGNAFLEDQRKKIPGVYPQTPGWLSEQCRLALITASPYYVTREIQDIIMGTARLRNTMEYSLQEPDLITPSGFLIFEDQVYLKDGRGRDTGLRAMSWRTGSTADGRRGVHVASYTDLMASDLHHADSYYGEWLESNSSNPKGYLITHFLLLGHNPVSFGEHKFLNVEVTEEQMELIEPGPEFMQGQYDGKIKMTPAIATRLKEQGVFFPTDIFLAAVLVMKQRIAGISGVHADRQAYRRFQREGITAPNMLNIVTLRRLVERGKIFPDEFEDNDVSWSHRWWVSGHWRYQYYPSRNEHEWIYIEPHVKGPEHLPLILKPDIYFGER